MQMPSYIYIIWYKIETTPKLKLLFQAFSLLCQVFLQLLQWIFFFLIWTGDNSDTLISLSNLRNFKLILSNSELFEDRYNTDFMSGSVQERKTSYILNILKAKTIAYNNAISHMPVFSLCVYPRYLIICCISIYVHSFPTYLYI